MKPTFVGIGVPKSGSTWLTENLRAHPDVFVPRIKETMFFGYRYTGNIEDYERCFDEAGNERAIGEYCTIYFSDENAPQRIGKHYPDIKLVLILRDPVEQLYSHYWHLASQNFHTNKAEHVSFEDALRTYPERLLKPALYGANLSRWLDVFSREQLLVLFYDEIKRAPGEVVRDVYRFLEVDDAFSSPVLSSGEKKVRPGVAPRSRIAGRLHRYVYAQLKVRVFDPLSARIGTERAWKWKDRLRARQVLNTMFMSDSYPNMDASTRRKLRNELRDEVLKTERLLDINLSAWRVEQCTTRSTNA